MKFSLMIPALEWQLRIWTRRKPNWIGTPGFRSCEDMIARYERAIQFLIAKRERRVAGITDTTRS